MENIQKVNSTTISAEKIIPEVRETREYDYDFLLKQRESINKQKAEQIAQRDLELAEVEQLIKGCEDLGVKSAIEIKEI